MEGQNILFPWSENGIKGKTEQHAIVVFTTSILLFGVSVGLGKIV